MDKNGVFGEILEQGQSTAKNAVTDVTNSVKSQVGVPIAKPKPSSSSGGFAGALKGQIGISDDTNNASSSDGFSDAIKAQLIPSDNKSQSASDGFAGAIQDQVGIQNETGGSKTAQKNQSDPSNKTVESNERTREVVSEFYEPTDKPVDQAKSQEQVNTQNMLAKTRGELQQFQDLHKQVYFEPLFAYEAKKPNQEDSTSERVEKMEMEDLKESKEKQDKMTPISVQRAQTSTEVNRGVAG